MRQARGHIKTNAQTKNKQITSFHLKMYFYITLIL